MYYKIIIKIQTNQENPEQKLKFRSMLIEDGFRKHTV